MWYTDGRKTEKLSLANPGQPHLALFPGPCTSLIALPTTYARAGNWAPFTYQNGRNAPLTYHVTSVALPT